MPFENPRHEVLANYPISFCVPVFFGDFPASDGAAPVSNGSGCIVMLHGRAIGVTCYHVVEAYRGRRRHSPATHFNFGPFLLDPDEYLIDQDPVLDIVTLDLTEYVSSSRDLRGTSLIQPREWPPRSVSDTDVLCFAGLPGVWRESIGSSHLRFYSFSSGATGTDSVGDLHLITRIYMDDTLEVLREGLVVGSLGGMSGGPVFAWRRDPILHGEFVGIIKEYQETLDLLYIRRATCITAVGQLINSAQV
jgi:hypothetical protein